MVPCLRRLHRLANILHDNVRGITGLLKLFTSSFRGFKKASIKFEKQKKGHLARVWNFDGRNAEHCAIEWSGP